MFDFEKLEAYKKSKLFYKQIINLLDSLTLRDQSLKVQLKRASLSICLNIAEGAGRFQKRDKMSFYINSRGSINECVAISQILLDNSYIDQSVYKELYSSLEELSKIVSGLINSQK